MLLPVVMFDCETPVPFLLEYVIYLVIFRCARLPARRPLLYARRRCIVKSN